MATDEHVDIPGDDDGDRQRQIVVSDPEDFARTRQLRSVFDARDEYQKQKTEVQRNRDLAWDDVNEQVWHLIQRFAFAIEPLAKKHSVADRFWEQKTYTVQNYAFAADVATTEEGIEYVAANHTNIYEKLQDTVQKRSNQTGGMLSGGETKIKKLNNKSRWLATSKPAEFEGISSMMGRTPSLAFMNDGPRCLIKETAPPVSLSDEIYRDLNNFIDSIGLGFDVETTQQTKIDDDLLQEVDEWRRQNV